MTENEAKEKLQAYLECQKKAVAGIYEQCNENLCDNCELCYAQGNAGEHIVSVEMAIKTLEEVQQYRQIGTVEECREAVKKQTAKKVTPNHSWTHYHFYCPICKSEEVNGMKYCPNCGQKLDWSDAE